MTGISRSSSAEMLVRAFTDTPSTEELIIFVAGTDNMLAYCQELIEQYDRNKMALLTLEINSLCAAKGVLPGLLYSEVRKVLIALNRFHHAGHDHFATLGLRENASIDEIKKTYRQLSKHYHPDMAGNDDAATQRFMEINGAYHSIMAARSDAPVAGCKSWREKSGSLATRHRLNQKIFLLTFIPLLLVLTAVTFYLSKKYDEQVLRRQLEAASMTGVYGSDPITPGPDRETAPEIDRESPLFQDVPDQPALAAIPLLAEPSPEDPVAGDQEKEQSVPAYSPAVREGYANAREKEAVDPVTAAAEKERDPVEPEEPVVPVSRAEKQASIHPAALIDTRPTPPDEQSVESLRQIVPEKDKPKPVREQKKEKDPEAAIQTILTRYADLYNSKDLDRFLALFSSNAMENGHPQADLIDQYRSLFTHTEAIDLNLETISWQQHENGFTAESRFKALYTYKNGHITKHSGNITFYLTGEPDGLKIQSLDYVFVN